MVHSQWGWGGAAYRGRRCQAQWKKRSFVSQSVWLRAITWKMHPSFFHPVDDIIDPE